MLNIDQYAYFNKLRNVHPVEKFVFVVFTMLICLVASSVPVSSIILVLMVILTVGIAQVPITFYLKLLSLPLVFLLIGIFTVVVSIHLIESNVVHWIYQVRINSWIVGITEEGLWQGINIFSKSLATVSCLYFLSLTTPMVELMSVLKRLKIPSVFLELMSLIYRFIFVLSDTALRIYTSQSARCGYATIGNSYRSSGFLISSLFTKTFQRAQHLYTSLLSRGYTGDLTVLEPEFSYSIRNIFLIVCSSLLLVVVAIFWR